jgi:4-carboxymuconolactone decarboxylase
VALAVEFGTTTTNMTNKRRIEPVKPEEMDSLQKQIADEIAKGPRQRVGELMLVWLHSPVLADLVQKVGAYFRTGTTLPQQIMEMIILLVARHWNCEFEWVAHEPLARQKGLKPEIIDAIRRETTPNFTDPAEKAAYEFTTSMLRTQQVPDQVLSEVQATLGKNGFIDMSILIGHYVHGAIVCKGAGLTPAPGTPAPFATA